MPFSGPSEAYLVKKDRKVVVTKDGPYLVFGALSLSTAISESDVDGEPGTWRNGKDFPERESYALCRCGRTGNHPYCDGTHGKTDFIGTETASRKEYLERATRTSGPGLDLTDARDLCASARFCHRAGGTWALTRGSDDPESREIAIQEASDCPAGRLVAWDKRTKGPIEPEFEPSISLVEDLWAKVSGPIWVRGFVPIESADGDRYEIRNRVTLCRCGKSGNKPFCDGGHVRARSRAGHKKVDE